MTTVSFPLPEFATVDQILDATAEYLGSRGWCQFALAPEGANGQFVIGAECCLLGAISTVITGQPDPILSHFIPGPGGVTEAQHSRIKAVLDALNDELELLPTGAIRCDSSVLFNVLAEWNDDPGQTADNVINTVETAASRYHYLTTPYNEGVTS